MSELSKAIDNCRSVKSRCLLIKQSHFSKTAYLAKLENDLFTEAGGGVECDDPKVKTDIAKSPKFAKKKRNRLRTNPSLKGESALELIKEDITDPERSSPLLVSSTEQHRRSPRKMLHRGETTSDSDEDDIKEHVLPPDNRGSASAAARKRSRAMKSRLMALHNQMPTEDYDGDLEDEVVTPARETAFDYSAAGSRMVTTSVEVHNALKRSMSSESSVETPNDNACLIPDKSAAVSTKKLSFDRLSASSPGGVFNLMEPLKHAGKSESFSSLKQFKLVLFGHEPSYESTV